MGAKGGMFVVVAGFLPVIALAVLLGGAASMATGGAGVGGLPAAAVAAYRGAAAAAEAGWGCVIPASLIGAIGAVESGHGTAGGSTIDPSTGQVQPPIYGPRLDGSGVGGNRTPRYDTDDGALDADTEFDRAVGPMQFLPSTWRGVEARLGTGDPQNFYDATRFAAWYLCGGSAADLTDDEASRAAILRYNRSEAYVAAVRSEQERLRGILDGQWGNGDPYSLLANPRFATSPAGQSDLESGMVDARLIGLLTGIVDQLELKIYASPFRTGHSRCVGGGDAPGCGESHHWYYRAIDISVVEGQAVSSGNADARRIANWLASFADADELSIAVGSPWPDYNEPGFFSDADHRNHIHLSVCGVRLRGGEPWSDCR